MRAAPVQRGRKLMGKSPPELTIRQARMWNGISLDLLVQATGISVARLSRMERGYDPCSPETEELIRQKIAEIIAERQKLARKANGAGR